MRNRHEATYAELAATAKLGIGFTKLNEANESRLGTVTDTILLQ